MCREIIVAFARALGGTKRCQQWTEAEWDWESWVRLGKLGLFFLFIIFSWLRKWDWENGSFLSFLQSSPFLVFFQSLILQSPRGFWSFFCQIFSVFWNSLFLHFWVFRLFLLQSFVFLFLLSDFGLTDFPFWSFLSHHPLSSKFHSPPRWFVFTFSLSSEFKFNF